MKGISSYERHNTTGDGLILNPKGQINEKINSIQEVGLKKLQVYSWWSSCEFTKENWGTLSAVIIGGWWTKEEKVKAKTISKIYLETK